MKISKMLVTAFVITATSTFAQSDYDSLKQKIIRMDLAIENIHFNMQESHKEFKTGTMAMIAGILLTSVGSHLYSTGSLETPTVTYAGIALTGVGGLLHINSHRFIGRGVWREKNLYE